jgi:hypothetical protein
MAVIAVDISRFGHIPVKSQVNFTRSWQLGHEYYWRASLSITRELQIGGTTSSRPQPGYPFELLKQGHQLNPARRWRSGGTDKWKLGMIIKRKSIGEIRRRRHWQVSTNEAATSEGSTAQRGATSERISTRHGRVGRGEKLKNRHFQGQYI